MSIIKKVPRSEQRIEYLKCSADPVYFLNTYGKVFDARMQMISDMECFDYQEDALDSFIDNRFNIILKSRQTGISVITAAYCAWRLMFGKDERILVVANDGQGAIRFLETCKQFIDYLPNFLTPIKPKGAPSIYKTENKKMLLFHNKCQIEAKAASPQAGRGESLTLLVLDEVAFIKDAPEIWKAASTALSMTKGDAILVSTPCGTGNLYHKIWSDAEKGKNKFNPITIHWTQNPIAAEELEYRIDDEGEEYPWSPWYEDQLERLNRDPVAVAQELDLSFEGSKHLVVSAKILRKYRYIINNNKIEPCCYFDISTDDFVSHKTPFYIWKKPNPNHNYIIGGDVSRGDGKDYSTLQIVDVQDMEQVGELKIKIDPDQLADIANVVGKLYNNAFIAIEVNSYGAATTFRLNKKLGYKNMYFCKNYKELYSRPSNHKEAALYKEGTLVPGFQTTTKTRPLLMSSLIKQMRERLIRINSKRLLTEFDTFVKVKDKEQHEKGFNDDLIFAFAIALYMRETEYQNIIDSKAATKAMLNSWGYSSSSSRYTQTPEMLKREGIKQKELDEKMKDKGGNMPIFLGNNSNSEDDMDDTSWLYD